MKSDHDLHSKKKVFPWDFGWCILVQMEVLNKTMQSIFEYLSRGEMRSEKRGLLCAEKSLGIWR